MNFVYFLEVGNHDKPRIGNTLGFDRIDAINMIVQTLPGLTITYYVRASIPVILFSFYNTI